MKLAKQIMDPRDPSIELHDVAGVALLFAHVGLAAHSAFHGAVVDLQGFGTGAAAVIAAMGGAGWMRGKQRAVDPAFVPPTEGVIQ